MPATRGELKMRAGAGDLEEHAVVAVVVSKSADLAEAEAVAVEGDQFREVVGVSRHADLDGAPRRRVGCGVRYQRRPLLVNVNEDTRSPNRAPRYSDQLPRVSRPRSVGPGRRAFEARPVGRSPRGLHPAAVEDHERDIHARGGLCAARASE